MYDRSVHLRWLLVSLSACGRIGFDPQSDDAVTGDPSIAALGSMACGQTTMSVTLAAAADGRIAIALAVRKSGLTGAVAFTDSKGTAYTTVLDGADNSGMRIVIGSAPATLAANDTITATFPIAFGSALAVDVLGPRGALLAAMSAGGNSATASASIDVAAPALVYCVLANANDRMPDAVSWQAISHVTGSCGGASNDLGLRTGYQQAAACEAMLGTQNLWEAGAAGFAQ